MNLFNKAVDLQFSIFKKRLRRSRIPVNSEKKLGITFL